MLFAFYSPTSLAPDLPSAQQWKPHKISSWHADPDRTRVFFWITLLRPVRRFVEAPHERKWISCWPSRTARDRGIYRLPDSPTLRKAQRYRQRNRRETPPGSAREGARPAPLRERRRPTPAQGRQPETRHFRAGLRLVKESPESAIYNRARCLSALWRTMRIWCAAICETTKRNQGHRHHRRRAEWRAHFGGS